MNILQKILSGKAVISDPRERAAAGKLTGVLGIGCNAVLFAAKLLVGLVTGSVSVVADAMNNLSDAASSVVTLVGFKLAGKPADSHHPYGHARYEYLSALAVAVLILVIGVELAKSAFDKILHPAPTEVSLPLIVVLVGAMVLKLGLFFLNRKAGRRIDSTTLLATAADCRNDVLTTGAVLLATLTEKLTSWQIDGYAALGVAGFILYSGAALVKQTVSPLLGEAASPELRKLIEDTVTGNDLVLGYHDLMVHDYGPGQRFASIHVEMDQREDPLVCHEIIDGMERTCLERHNVHLVIHYDPVVTDDPVLNQMQALVTQILQDIDPRLSLHDFRMVQGKAFSNLIFDVVTPRDLMDNTDALRQQINSALATQCQGTYHTVILFDPET